ncbi:hypothetical protein H1R20_g8864, partial [Candolleomyces eurysporus]
MAELAYTPVDEIPKIHAELRAGFNSGKLKSIEYRKYQLLQLAYLVQENADRIEKALHSDLGRPAIESRLTAEILSIEINTTIGDALTAYENVEKWAKPEKPPFHLNWTLMKPTIYKEAKGVVVIISPFNYPVWLTLGILAGSIAAGNCTVLKPAESTPATSSLFAELVPKYLDNDLVRVINGAVPETTKILELPWDHILYTGSGRVAKIVSAAAAKHLTPVTLELGGKSPVIIDPNCDLESAASRILWGKVVNAGQTCVAPDYILVPRSFQDTFVDALKKKYQEFYPGAEGPKKDDAYARIVTKQAWGRIKGLLDGTKGTVVIGGEVDEQGKYIAPTIVKDVPGDDSLMSEEIFGPLLPIVPVEDIDEAIRYVNAHDHPLALYVFTKDDAVKKKVLTSTQSGAFSAGEVLIHPGVEGLPFGGIGPSGSGYHTGKYTFDTFTHFRAALDSPSWLDKILGFRYPPYSDKKLKATDRFKRKLPAKPTGPPTSLTTTSSWRKWWVFALAIAIAAGLTKRRAGLAN